MATMSPGNTPATPNLASLIAAEAALARNADNLTSGTVVAARVGDLSATYAPVAEPIAAAETTRATAAEALKLAKASNLSDIASAVTARANLAVDAARGEFVISDSQYGATTGSSDNKTAIDAAINAANAAGGGVVYFPKGTWKTSGGHIVYPNVYFVGAGKTTTIIQLANASNVDLFKAQNFATNTGTTGSGGPTHWGFRDLTLDGNGANQSATSWPLRVFGRSYTLNGVDIINGYSGCFWTEWGNGGSDMESLVINCKFHDNLAGDTVSNYGPHDAKWAHSMIYHCGTVTPGRGLVLGTNAGAGQNGANGTVHTDIHMFGAGTTGVEVGSGGVIFENCISEGFTTDVYFNTGSAGSAWHGGMIFGTNGSGETGFVTAAGLNNITLDNPYMFNFGTGSWIFNFGNGGKNYYKAQVKLATATIWAGAGYVGASDHVEIDVQDAVASSVFSAPFTPTYRNGFTVTAGTVAVKNSSTDQFSVVPTTGRVAVPNGAFLAAYSDAYTTQTAGIKGSTGAIQAGSTAGLGASVFSGSGAPTIAGTVGDLYVRTNASTGQSWLYRCTTTGGAGVAVWTRMASRAEVLSTAQGLVSENFPRSAMASSQLTISGTAYFMSMGLLAGDVVTKLNILVTTAGASMTLSKVGLYDSSGTLLASSADQGTAWQSTGLKQISLSSPYTVTADGGYYAAVVAIGSTMPILTRGFNFGPSDGVGSGMKPYGTQLSQTDLPSPATIGLTSPIAFWIGAS
jgi:hypothetical protein